MGKTFRKDKTVAGQRRKLHISKKTSKQDKFEEFDFDPNADNDRGLTNDKEIPATEAIPKQGSPQSPN